MGKQTPGETASTSLARMWTVVTCCVALVLPVAVSGQTLKSTYPRIGAYEIAGTHDTVKPEYRQALARHDIVIMGMWRNWSGTDTASGQLLNMRDVVIDIKRRASQLGNDQMLIGKYTMYMENGTDPGVSPHNERWQKLTDNNWWAKKSNGEKTSSYPGNSNTNITEYVRRDSNGDTWPEWAAKRDYELFFRDVPELDIWFIDNWFFKPRVTADWDGDGRDDDKNSAAVGRDYRKGSLNALRRIQELAPDRIVMGNVDGEPQNGSGMLTEPEFRGEITSLHEGAIGYNWSPETWGGWETMMRQYQTTIANSRNRLAIMTVHGDAPDDYALMRYGLASCLMDDGYYYYTTHDTEYRSALWFDEFDVDLGRAIDPPQFSPWQNGVYRRRFENGVVLVNPKGNGRRRVDLEPGYSRINGTQDRSTNNGQPVASVSLDDRDGLILLSSDADRGSRPKPPQLNNR
ncbi:MAG: putative glycoside hydrolase [Woeseiaceae bacterium]